MENYPIEIEANTTTGQANQYRRWMENCPIAVEAKKTIGLAKLFKRL
jgi:hypothetical protein